MHLVGWIAIGLALAWVAVVLARGGQPLWSRRFGLPPRRAALADPEDLEKILRRLGPLERFVLAKVLRRQPVTRDHAAEFDASLTLGERVADRVAAFGGSWSFIFLFLAAMAVWMAINSGRERPFDPYPFILLNLVLSCLAALQAPVIMMSQNRQASKDRLQAQHDYEINLKAEMEILALHEKLDALQVRQLGELLAVQGRHEALLREIAARLVPAPENPLD